MGGSFVKTIEIILVLILIGATLAFGGVTPVAYSLTEVFLFLALFLLVLKQIREGRIRLPLPVWPVLFVVWIVIQVIPLPSWFASKLSPARLLDHDIAAVAPTREAWMTFSIYPHDTNLGLVKLLAYVTAFVLTAYLFDSRKEKTALVPALIFIGCIEAVYGIVQSLTGWQQIFTYTKQYNVLEATGTYINYNHFAGLLELTAPFAAASAFYSFRIWAAGRHAPGHRRPLATSSSAGVQSIFYSFLLVIMVLACFLSHSRIGIFGILFSIMFITLLANRGTARGVWTLGVFFFMVCVLGYGLWVGLRPIVGRFTLLREPSYLQMEGRIGIWHDGVRLLHNYPLTGTGLGTFQHGFRRYQTALVNSFVDHAHNDYLEFASDTGLVGAALLFLPIFALFVRMVISFLEDSQRYRRAVTLGCIGSSLAMLLHSATDFNLQIPANALIFAVVLGMGYKASCVERREDSQINSLPATSR